ncbi:SpoVG family protein (plasmid) [Oscillospiraceae bacterium MB08-C2-2]|nr:SpoVG family protein [Oscillospiraceae bacterium MB08-C2-2]
MNIELTRLRRIDHHTVKAVASLLIDGELAVHDIKLLEISGGLLVTMPNKQDKHGQYRDMVHPIHTDLRIQIETLILNEYRKTTEPVGA